MQDNCQIEIKYIPLSPILPTPHSSLLKFTYFIIIININIFIKPMTRIFRLFALAVMAGTCMSMFAQGLTFRGVYQTSRNDDNNVGSEYVGWNYALQKMIFIVPQGLYKMQ